MSLKLCHVSFSQPQYIQRILLINFFLFSALVFLVYVLKDFNGLLTNILNFTAILLIYHYRTITGSVLLFDFKESTSKTSLIIFWLNIVEIYAINYLPALHRYLFHKEVSPQSVKNCLGAHVTAFSLISALLHKPHNAILVPVCVWTLERCFKSCDKLFRENNAVMYKVILSYWLGRAFFFLQVGCYALLMSCFITLFFTLPFRVIQTIWHQSI